MLAGSRILQISLFNAIWLTKKEEENAYQFWAQHGSSAGGELQSAKKYQGFVLQQNHDLFHVKLVLASCLKVQCHDISTPLCGSKKLYLGPFFSKIAIRLQSLKLSALSRLGGHGTEAFGNYCCWICCCVRVVNVYVETVYSDSRSLRIFQQNQNVFGKTVLACSYRVQVGLKKFKMGRKSSDTVPLTYEIQGGTGIVLLIKNLL